MASWANTWSIDQIEAVSNSVVVSCIKVYLWAPSYRNIKDSRFQVSSAQLHSSKPQVEIQHFVAILSKRWIEKSKSSKKLNCSHASLFEHLKMFFRKRWRGRFVTANHWLYGQIVIVKVKTLAMKSSKFALQVSNCVLISRWLFVWLDLLQVRNQIIFGVAFYWTDYWTNDVPNIRRLASYTCYVFL